MSLTEVLPSVQSLSPDDKLRLFRILAGELRDASTIAPLETGKEYPVWSPFDAHEAAILLQQALLADESAR